MIAFNLKDGSTVKLDLENEEDRNKWSSLRDDNSFQSSIRGVSIHRNGMIQALPHPKKFSDKKAQYDVKLLWSRGDKTKLAAESVICFISNLMINLKVYANSSPPMSRLDISRQGKIIHKVSASIDDHIFDSNKSHGHKSAEK